ncbi:MAG TPA: GGDEF domain-containing protein [Paenibacillus sp.]|nr:GGDEF domain-containing protein [Paenibacillus sp.]
MFHRNWIRIFTSSTFVCAVAVNYFFPFLGLWMLFLLPMFGAITLYPRWIAGHFCALFMACIRLLTQYAAFSGDIPRDYLVRFVSTSTVAWIILLTFTLLSIRLHRSIQNLESLSYTDLLTQAYNRRYLELHSEKLLAHSHDSGRPLCLLLLDIDHFKHINDTHGHIAGDNMLIQLTRLIQQVVTRQMPLVRLGGEEFALLLPDASLSEGLQSAERIRKAVETARFESNGVPIPVTVSVGAAPYRGGSLGQLMEQADRALYRAKATGRNKVAAAESPIAIRP